MRVALNFAIKSTRKKLEHGALLKLLPKQIQLSYSYRSAGLKVVKYSSSNSENGLYWVSGVPKTVAAAGWK